VARTAGVGHLALDLLRRKVVLRQVRVTGGDQPLRADGGIRGARGQPRDVVRPIAVCRDLGRVDAALPIRQPVRVRSRRGRRTRCGGTEAEEVVSGLGVVVAVGPGVWVGAGVEARVGAGEVTGSARSSATAFARRSMSRDPSTVSSTGVRSENRPLTPTLAMLPGAGVVPGATTHVGSYANRTSCGRTTTKLSALLSVAVQTTRLASGLQEQADTADRLGRTSASVTPAAPLRAPRSSAPPQRRRGVRGPASPARRRGTPR
jgi:hypothetical protein